MQKAAIYDRASTADQHIELHICDLHQFAEQRRFVVVREHEERGVSEVFSPSVELTQQAGGGQ